MVFFVQENLQTFLYYMQEGTIKLFKNSQKTFYHMNNRGILHFPLKVKNFQKKYSLLKKEGRRAEASTYLHCRENMKYAILYQELEVLDGLEIWIYHKQSIFSFLSHMNRVCTRDYFCAYTTSLLKAGYNECNRNVEGAISIHSN